MFHKRYLVQLDHFSHWETLGIFYRYKSAYKALVYQLFHSGTRWAGRIIDLDQELRTFNISVERTPVEK